MSIDYLIILRNKCLLYKYFLLITLLIVTSPTFTNCQNQGLVLKAKGGLLVYERDIPKTKARNVVDILIRLGFFYISENEEDYSSATVRLYTKEYLLHPEELIGEKQRQNILNDDSELVFQFILNDSLPVEKPTVVNENITIDDDLPISFVVNRYKNWSKTQNDLLSDDSFQEWVRDTVTKSIAERVFPNNPVSLQVIGSDDIVLWGVDIQ